MFAYSVQKGGNERKTKCLHRRQERLTYEVVAGVKSLFTSPYTHTLTHFSLVFRGPSLKFVWKRARYG